MKRIVAFLLCLVLVCSAMVTSVVAAETAFTYFTNTSTPLFLISGSNKSGQEFVPDQAGIKGIKVYLSNESANNAIDVAVYSGTPETGNQIYTETLALERVAADWFTLSFSKEVAVTVGELHSFVIHTANRAIWNGATVDGDYKAWNYDVSAYGGWTRGNIAAFEIIGAVEALPAYEQITKDIAALPPLEEITMEHYDTVMEIYDRYVKLSTADRNLVQGFENLVYAKQKIEDLIYREEHKARFEIEDAITALGTITTASRDALVKIDQMLYAYAYENGTEVVKDIENYQTYLDAVTAYNGLDGVAEKQLCGDPNGDKSVSAADALLVLQQVVGKVKMTDDQVELADVDDDTAVSAADALMILQFVVGKVKKFPADKEAAVETVEPVYHQLPLYSVKGESLYAETYQSMLDRIQENGYAQTSLNGAYEGMFCRDSSIQVMAHVAQGDYSAAAKILKYIVDYHNTYKRDYVMHIMQDGKGPYSDKLQTDTTFFFLHAWYMYATKAPASAEKTALLNATEEKVKAFADYFIDGTYFDRDKGLIENRYLEHSRDSREWYSYDLLTNVYASQAWHELSRYFATKDPARAKSWKEAADLIAKGVHTHLVTTIDGKTMYAELYDLENETFVQGFSWVNMAPVGCEWYAMDDEIMANTYALYMKYGAGNWFGKYKMLEVHVKYTGSTNTRAREVIGKGLAWELMYCKMVGNTDRIRVLEAFIENYSVDMYRETWQASGGGSDSGNQEHASWMLFAHKYCHPELDKKKQEIEQPVIDVDEIRVGTYNIHILTEANNSPATIANVIRESKAVVVGLQEVDNNTGRNGSSLHQAKALAEELGWYWGYSKAISLGTGEYGNAIISQYPIQSYKTIQLTSGAEQRVMGHAVIKIGDKAVNFLNTHLEQSDPTRATQINEIAQYGQELDSFILTGDFNTSAANLTPIGATILRNSGIDNILLKNYSGSDPVVVNNSYSDHKMVYADVSLTPVVTGARIATFNTHILQDVKGNAATMANFIQSHNLEIVGLQEVDNNTGRNGCTINQAKALAEELGWYWGYSKAISLGSGEYGHAIISKYPIQSYKTVQLGSASEEQRVFGHAVIQAGDHTINFLNTHLSWQNMQMPQIAEIADYVKNMNSYIITGDFNTLYENLTSIAGTKVNNGTDVFITNEDGAIDNIIVKGYTVGKGTMVETEYSDHNMLYANVTF